jgi:long-chain acyl-CoA synthetase
VAPVPIESSFARCPMVEQQCLLGRGYSKTVMVCVLSPQAQGVARDSIEQALREQAETINQEIEKHARIGAVIVSMDPWTIDNGVLTPTLKLRREAVESRFGEQAEALARSAAEQGGLLIAWEDG